jgi:NAD(P)H dehydrogenase (quinone)
LSCSYCATGTHAASGPKSAHGKSRQDRDVTRDVTDGLEVAALHFDDDHVDDGLMVALANGLLALRRLPGRIFHCRAKLGGVGAARLLDRLLEQIEQAVGVRAEQVRIERAASLILVYPVYWWSMPGLLKGWIDRVFANGWAYDEGADGKLVKRLHHMRVHLVAIAGADLRTYARHGYFGAMKTQIDHGIFDYCGARVVASELLVGAATKNPAADLEAARTIGHKIFRQQPAAKAAA